MKVVVGLGNPGRRYERTPHNVGRRVVEELAARFKCRLRMSLRMPADVGRAEVEGQGVLLVRPRTFMNESGQAVAGAARKHGLEPAELVVVLDDADLDVGRLRIRRQGSSGGHKGLLSIEQAIGTSQFPRVRIGIGRGRGDGDLVGHVLGTFTPREEELVGAAVGAAADAVVCILLHGVDKAMNDYNAFGTKRGDGEVDVE